MTQLSSDALQCRGFSPALTKLKEELSEQHPELPRENPGSRWPKTSLGALRDDQRLTPGNLRTLMDLCRQVNPLNPQHVTSDHTTILNTWNSRLCLCMFSGPTIMQSWTEQRSCTLIIWQWSCTSAGELGWPQQAYTFVLMFVRGSFFGTAEMVWCVQQLGQTHSSVRPSRISKHVKFCCWLPGH